MRQQLTLIAPSSPAKIGDITVLVTCVHIEAAQVEYTVAWWCEGMRYDARVPEYEITNAELTMTVGFQ